MNNFLNVVNFFMLKLFSVKYTIKMDNGNYTTNSKSLSLKDFSSEIKNEITQL